MWCYEYHYCWGRLRKPAMFWKTLIWQFIVSDQEYAHAASENRDPQQLMATLWMGKSAPPRTSAIYGRCHFKHFTTDKAVKTVRRIWSIYRPRAGGVQSGSQYEICKERELTSAWKPWWTWQPKQIIKRLSGIQLHMASPSIRWRQLDSNWRERSDGSSKTKRFLKKWTSTMNKPETSW